jgi:hypothetical protein
MEMTSTQLHEGAAITYLVGVDSTKTRIIIFSEKHVKHTVANGSSFKALIVKPTTILNNI